MKIVLNSVPYTKFLEDGVEELFKMVFSYAYRCSKYEFKNITLNKIFCSLEVISETFDRFKDLIDVLCCKLMHIDVELDDFSESDSIFKYEDIFVTSLEDFNFKLGTILKYNLSREEFIDSFDVIGLDSDLAYQKVYNAFLKALLYDIKFYQELDAQKCIADMDMPLETFKSYIPESSAELLDSIIKRTNLLFNDFDYSNGIFRNMVLSELLSRDDKIDWVNLLKTI